MKITAEFNSLDELIKFGNKLTAVIDPMYFQESEQITEEPKQGEGRKEVQKADETEITKPVQLHSPDKEEAPKEEPKTEAPKEETAKVTKEMVRERLGAAMKAGKQKEVKELVAKFGAAKVPDLKEEDYAAVYVEAGGLI